MKKIYFLLAALLIAITSISQEKTVDTEKSKLKWTGKKVTGEHWGYIKIKSGAFILNDNMITNGEFIIDMTTMTCKDLEDKEWNDKLIGHLKSDDFFSVEKYNSAILKIDKSTKFQDGVANVKGDLTIKGITKPISFKAKIEGKTYKATITVDRTLYDVRYGSGKFFDGLGDKMIYDDFVLDVTIATK